MSIAGVAAQEIRVPLKTGFLHDGHAMGKMKTCWGSRSEFEKAHFEICSDEWQPLCKKSLSEVQLAPSDYSLK
uniref:ERBB receptor feedback inhibitor 1 n=1 Tax=Equus caballus TaxID=9796 RepID=A0A5F5PT97_HORSE